MRILEPVSENGNSGITSENRLPVNPVSNRRFMNKNAAIALHGKLLSFTYVNKKFDPKGDFLDVMTKNNFYARNTQKIRNSVGFSR